MDEQLRIQRALTQRIYLLGTIQGDRGQTIYQIQGTTGTEYEVDVTRSTCTCVDFQQRWQPCKHIFFVIHRVLQQQQQQQQQQPNVRKPQENPPPDSKSSPVSGKQLPYVGETCAVCLDDMTAASPVLTCFE